MADEERTLLRIDVDDSQGRAALDARVAQLQSVASAEHQAAAAAQERASAVNLGIGAGSGSVITGGSSGFDFTGTASHQAAQAEAAAVKQTTDALRDQAIAEEYLHERRQMAIGDIERRSANERAANLGIGGGNGGVVGGSGDIDALITGKAAKSVTELNQAMAQGERGREAFTMAIGMANPGLGMMARMAMQAREAVALLATPVGATAAAIAVLVGLLELVTGGLNAAAKRAREFAEEQERVKKATIGVQEVVAKELGNMGKGGEETFNTATATAKRLEAKGFDPGVSARVAAATTSDAGTSTLSSAEDEYLMAAGVQSGRIKLPESGAQESERRQAMSLAMKELRRSEKELGASAAAYMRPRAQSKERASEQLSETDLVEIAKRNGMDEQAARQAARDFVATKATGDIDAMDHGALRVGFNWALENSNVARAMNYRSEYEVRRERVRDLASVVINNHGSVNFPGGAGVPQREPRQTGM